MVANRGFTIIELLVTITIIGILVALLMPGIRLVQRAVQASQTRALVTSVAASIAATALERGSLPGMAPHPLAGSAPPRLAFVRGEAAYGYAIGAAVDTAAEALVCEKPVTVSGSPPSLLLPSDRFDGTEGGVPMQPLLYGLRRDELTVLGSGAGLVRHLRLPEADAVYDQNGDGLLDTPYTTARYPANRFLVLSGPLADLAPESQRTITSALRGSDLQELTGNGSLATAATGTPILAGRLVAAGTATATAWKAGLVRDPADGAWKGYRLPGTALYDRWGRELLCQVDAKGGLTVLSAGPDGVFRWHPGIDGVYQTAAADSAAAGDDRDGSTDNIGSR
jgi:prepilin-type N-terminal cleavage/methylation domain-containing protein